jgi:hypothetical protein
VQAIYELRLDDYVRGAKDEDKGMVELDVDARATRLGVQAVSVRGRLYYRLNVMYEQVGVEGLKPFYVKPTPQRRPLINFPALEAVYAGLAQERRRDDWTRRIALGSAAIALISLVVTLALGA